MMMHDDNQAIQQKNISIVMKPTSSILHGTEKLCEAIICCARNTICLLLVVELVVVVVVGKWSGS